jgi:sensor histidine kinase YesM
MSGISVRTEIRDISILIAAGFFMTWTGLVCSSCKENTRQLLIVGSFTSLLWILLWKGNEYLGNFISARISWLRFPMRRFIVGSVATVVYTLLAMYVLTAVYERSFSQRIGTGVLVSVIITIAISLFMHGREFLLNWRRSAIMAEQYQKESVAARYESLKSQVNPHFLFNSLNALSNLIYEDERKAAVFIQELSGIYRYVIDTQERETVPLREELAFLESYIYLQQIRFGEKLRVSIDLKDVSAEVAPLALQMLIENAIKHNVISEEDPLEITVETDGDFIMVTNNLQKKKSLGEDSPGLGLENIRRRYEMLTTEEIQVERTPGHFRVKLPLLKKHR